MPHAPAFIHKIDLSWMAVAHSYTSPVLDWAAWILSAAGYLGAGWWVLAGVFWLRKRRFLAAQMALSMVIGGVAAEVLKHLTHRLRPSAVMPQYVHLVLPNLHDSRWSFPSGHAVLAAAAAFTVVFATNKRWAWWLVMAAILICWSRVYEGLHWPSDVFAGFIIGMLSALVSVLISTRFENKAIFQSAEEQHNRAAAQPEPHSAG